MRAAAALALLAGFAAAGLERAQSVRPAFPVAAWRLEDVNADGRADLLLIGTAGEVRTWVTDPETGRLEKDPRGKLVLKHPRRTLLALADFLRDGGPPQLLVLDPDGASVHRAGPGGAFETERIELARRARFRLRTNEPVFADVVQYVNADKRLDLVVPGSRFSELWIQREEGFERAARITIDVERTEARRAEALSDRLSIVFRIPRLRIADVNGDTRRDLLVRAGRTRAFHLQREDGSIPALPDVTVDLSIFRDTTPKAALRPGKTLAVDDKARYETRDLDGDGIPDYVIAHRRKVWIFHGNADRPQFTDPTSILKVSDDVTAMLLTHLDEDKYPDLLLFKVHVPTVAGLLLGVLRSLKIDILVRGYANKGGRTFERSPKWKSEITIKIPSIVSILKDPGALIERVEDVGKKFRVQRSGDLDGDGATETLLLSEDKTRIDVWKGTRKGADDGDTIETGRSLRRILFEEKDRTWDFDRILSFFGGLAERRTAELTGGREPDRTLELRDEEGFELVDYDLADLDGKGGQAIVIRYLEGQSDPRPVFDVVRWK